MTMDLSGRTAIVTGASRGIGAAIAGTLARAGANVVITARRAESAEGAATLLAAETGATVIGIGAHAADEESAQRRVSEVVDRFGRLDILVNNAGTNPAYGPLIAQDAARFHKTFEVNTWAPLMWTGLAARAWMGENGGSVVNIASIGGLVMEPGLGVYNASKAALIHITKQLAMELSPTVRVNAVLPGVVRTKLAEALWKDHETALAASVAVGRIGEPSDVASAVAYLVSDAAAWVTGEAMVVDGGQRLGDAAQFQIPGALEAADV